MHCNQTVTRNNTTEPEGAGYSPAEAAGSCLTLNVGPTGMMNRTDIANLLRDPLLRIGLAAQCISALLIAIVILSIRMKWIDVIEIGLRNGIDKPSPQLDALYWGFRLLVLLFGAGFFLYAAALHRMRKKRRAQPSLSLSSQPHK